MKKRFLCLLLILVMTLSLLPTAVLADEAETDYGITIVSPDATTQIDVTSKNYKDVMLDGTVSYDPETKVLTLNDANLGCIRASQIQKPLTLRLVGDNTITTPQGIYSNALTMDSLSIEGNGRLHVKAQLYAANFYVGISYQQSGGEVTLEGFGVLNGSSGSVKLTGGKLTLIGGMPQMDKLLDAADGTKLALFYEDGRDAGSWTLPTDSTNWSGLLSTVAKMTLTAPAALDEASLAELKEKETYYFDLSGSEIRHFTTRNEALPDASLHYVPFTYTGTLNNVFHWKYRDSYARAFGSWPLFVADYNISQVSWNDLHAEGLIYGKSYQSGGVTYTMRAPSSHDPDDQYTTEWSCIKDYTKNLNSGYSWAQEFFGTGETAGLAALLSDPIRTEFTDKSYIYYRPVLQPTNLNGQTLHVVTLVVGENRYNVVAGDTVSPASIDGLLNDGDELKNGYYWHDAENGKYYRSDEQIPVTDDITLEAVKGRYGIKITDEKGVEHLLRQGTYILNLGDCGDIYYATGSEFILTLTDAKLRSIECDMDLTLRLLGSSSIAAKGDEDAIHAGSLCISTTATGDGRLSISAKDGQAYKPLDTSRTYKQESDHVTMPESALNQFERFSFSGGTLTLLGADTETFVNIDRCLKAGKIADGTELRLVNEDGVTVFSKKTPLEDPEDWDFLAINAVHAKKLHLIADGEELPPEIVEPEEPDEPKDPKEPEKPSIEPILIGGSVLLAGGDRNPFSDVRAIDWYYDDVMYAYDRGLIRGTAYNKFSPKDSFTRGMLLTILARHDGVSTKGTPWYQAGCDWAARNGISDGKNPEEAVSREEFALTLYRYAQYRGSNLLSGNSLSSFTDASAVSDAALPAVQWAVSEAILRGDNFYLHPQSGATRAEAAAMLHRFFAR